MNAKFYDVKEKQSVTTAVVEKIQYENGRCAFRGKTKDGRNLTLFVSKADFDKAADVKVGKPAKKKAACKCCKK